MSKTLTEYLNRLDNTQLSKVYGLRIALSKSTTPADYVAVNVLLKRMFKLIEQDNSPEQQFLDQYHILTNTIDTVILHRWLTENPTPLHYIHIPLPNVYDNDLTTNDKLNVAHGEEKLFVACEKCANYSECSMRKLCTGDVFDK